MNLSFNFRQAVALASLGAFALSAGCVSRGQNKSIARAAPAASSGDDTQKIIDAVLLPTENVTIARCGFDEVVSSDEDRRITALAPHNMHAEVYRTQRGAFGLRIQISEGGIPTRVYDGRIRSAENASKRGGDPSPAQLQLTTYGDRTKITVYGGPGAEPQIIEGEGQSRRVELTLTYKDGRYNAGIEDQVDTNKNMIFSDCDLVDNHIGQNLARSVTTRAPSQAGDDKID